MAKQSQFNLTFTYRGQTWLKLYKTYIKPSLMYACEAWRPSTKDGVEKLESVQRRALQMAGGLDRNNYEEACRKAGMNTIEEELKEADLVRTFRILNGDDKVKKETFWELEEARAGAGRRRFKVKEIKRTLALQSKNVRKTCFGSRIQDPWNDLEDHVELAKTPKAFRMAYKKSKNLF